MQIVLAVITLILYLITYYVYGLLLGKVCRVKEYDLTLTVIGGMFLYAIAFFLVAIPCKFCKVSLHALSYAWLGIWALSLLGIAWWCKKKLFQPLKTFARKVKDNKLNFTLFVLIVLAQLVFMELYGRLNGSNNPTYYIGYVTTALFNDSLGLIDPRSGEVLTHFHEAFTMESYMEHSAVVCFLTGMHPLIETRCVSPFAYLLLGNAMVWKLCEVVFGGNRQKQFVGFSCYQGVAWIFSRSVLLPSYYYFFRVSEGKSVFPLIVVPVLLYCFWVLYDNAADIYTLLFGFVVVAGSFTYTAIAMYAALIALVGFAPGLFTKQWKRQLINFVILALPCLVYGVYYFCVQRGWITLTI